LAYTFWYIFAKIDPDRIDVLNHVREFNLYRAVRGWAPMIATVILLLNTGKGGAIFFFPWFAAMAIYYSILCKDWENGEGG